MDKDDLLRRAHTKLLQEHAVGDGEFGATDPCEVCDLLDEIDKSLEPISTSALVCCAVDCTEEGLVGVGVFQNHECKCTCKPQTIWPGRPVD